MPDIKKFGDDVVEAMGDMSQREVIDQMADHGARVSQGTISNMRHGRVPESMDVVRAFALAVGQDPDQWEIKARLYATELELRDRHKISEASLRKILQDIEEEEEKHRKGIKH